ncbi:MAG: 4-hydroxy-tetrahydrodipicolinate synthase [Bacteroidia bacterium]|nr:4-hydroxy-tetrahydrodipicolinate synthase [Bacteroidia bacterium]
MSPLAKKLSGTGVALVTPFHKNGSVDFKSLSRLVDHVIKGKCEYVVPLGTTGESVTLSADEKKAVLDCVVESAAGKVPVVMGLGGNNTQEILEKLRHHDFQGVSALLSVSPYYNKPSQKGILQHYKMIAEESPLPVILYNVPGRTGSNMLPETTLELAHGQKNILGIKEASGNVEQVMHIIREKPAGFLVISGDDAITLPLIAAGADGVISVIANAYPKAFSTMVRHALKAELKKAQQLHYQLLPLIPLLFSEGSPAGIKCALKGMGMMEEHVRLPLVNVSKPLAQRILACCTAL